MQATSPQPLTIVNTVCTSKPDLWVKALANLPANDRKEFNTRGLNRLEILAEILSSVEKLKQSRIDRRWAFKYRQKTIILHDTCEKIAGWINKFKEVGDVAAQFDPKHASLPWAAIRFILQAAVNHHETFAAMAEGVELVTNLIISYSRYEILYLGKDSALKQPLENAITKVYSAVLMYLLKTQRYFSRNTAIRVAMGTFQTAEQAVSSLAKDILDADRFVKQFIDILKAEESEREKVLKWLSEVPCRKHHEIESCRRLAGTCRWIHRDQKFISWKQSALSSVLWLHGIPGSGKTIVVSSVIDSFYVEASASNQSTPVCYFYCQRNPAEAERSAPEEILRSVVKQLAVLENDKDIKTPILEVFQKKMRVAKGCEPDKLTLEEATTVVLKILEQTPAIIIIDAIDEVDPLRRHELLASLQLIVRDSPSLVRVLVSSRDDGDIVCHLDGLPDIYMNMFDNEDDIEIFVLDGVDKAIQEKRLIKGRVSDALRYRIVQALINKGRGMFRWVSVQLQSLCDSRRIKVEEDIETQLSCLPKTLEHSYDIIYENIDLVGHQGRALAERTVKWLLYCQCTLTSQEFIAGVAFDFTRPPTVDEVLDVCCNLVVHDQQLDVFRFAHLSVREYVESRAECSPIQGHLQILNACLFYLVKGIERHRCCRDDAEMRIWHYVSIYWPVHAEYTETHRTPDVQERLLQFTSNDRSDGSPFTQWLSECDQLYFGAPFCVRKRLSCAFDTTKSPVFVACVYGLISILEFLLMQGQFDGSLRNYDGDSPLTLLIMHNHKDTTLRFIKQASFTTKCTENDLVAAARVETTDMELLTALLDRARGTDITEKVAKAAVRNRKRGKEFIRLLLLKREDLRMSEGILKEAAKNEEGPGVIEFLLRSQSDLVITTDVLKAAVENRGRSEEVVETLWEAMDDKGITDEILIAAAMHESEDQSMMQMLWDHAPMQATKINNAILKAAVQNPRGPRKHLKWLWEKISDLSVDEDTVLAAVRNWEFGLDLVKFLWEKTGGFPITEEFLKAAVWNWKNGESIVRFLSTKEDLMISKDVLHIAAKHGSKEAVQFLLAHLGNPPTEETVIQFAAENDISGLDIVKFLWERENDPPVTTEVLRRAAGNVAKGREILEFLWKNRNDLEITETVLVEAAANENIGHSIITFILDNTPQRTVSMAVLEAAATAGQEKVLRLLQSQCNSCDMEQLFGIARFFNASKTGDSTEIQRLLHDGVTTDSRNIRGVTPLWRAASWGNLDIVKILLATGKADPNSRSIGNRGPIFWPSENGFTDIVSILLEHGADPNVPDNHGRTPYSIAKERNHRAVLRVLEEFNSSP